MKVTVVESLQNVRRGDRDRQALDHPNIIKMLDDEGQHLRPKHFVFVLAYVDGRTSLLHEPN